jgi:GAF domain-containing protein/HAMP domain-containing protein
MLVVSCVMMIEYGLLNARLVLLPTQPELQKAGLRGTRLQTRLAVLVMSLIGVSILLVAPRSYQVAVDIMNGETISLYALRTELISVAAIAVAVGIVFTILISRIIYRPIAHLIEVMSDIERGNIQRRADILSTDEVGLATIQFNTMIERFENLQRRMDDEVQKRTWDLERKSSQLQAAAQVARESAAIQDLYNLLNHSVNLISERFGFYHAGIFITDQSKQNVVLQAASSPGGQKMLERGHQLRVGGQGIVGAAAASGRPRIALDVGADSVFFNNPDLPETHSEMALPLSVRGNLIGVLDIQSTETQAFSQDDLVILQTLADQIALAIENARLLFESQQAIRQLQISTGQSIRTGWQQYTSRRKHAYVYTPLSVQAFNKETSASKQGQNVLEVPIKLRGQTIGNLSFQRASTENTWGEIEQSMTSEIASQIGLAIENARLIEEQLKLAERERQMNAIINEIRKSTSTDKVLQYTAREIGKALGAVRTFAQLGLPQQAEPDKNVNKQKTGSKSA